MPAAEVYLAQAHHSFAAKVQACQHPLCPTQLPFDAAERGQGWGMPLSRLLCWADMHSMIAASVQGTYHIWGRAACRQDSAPGICGVCGSTVIQVVG